jgi:hypothetical protein
MRAQRHEVVHDVVALGYRAKYLPYTLLFFSYGDGLIPKVGGRGGVFVAHCSDLGG